eukprot:scaffold20361_cov102-Isochrysis_galbana.AAC.7
MSNRKPASGSRADPQKTASTTKVAPSHVRPLPPGGKSSARPTMQRARTATAYSPAAASGGPLAAPTARPYSTKASSDSRTRTSRWARVAAHSCGKADATRPSHTARATRSQVVFSSANSALQSRFVRSYLPSTDESRASASVSGIASSSPRAAKVASTT